MTRPARRYTFWRRCCQLAVAAVFAVLPPLGSTAVQGTMVSLGVGGVDLVEPSAAASAALAARALPWALLLGLVPVTAVAVALGPVYCSWACPFGLLSELLDRRLRPRARWAGRPWVRARRTRWIALASLLVGSAALGIPLAALLAPPRLVTAFPLEAWAARAVPVLTSGLLLAVLVLEVIGPRRIVCRALCPAGAAATLLRTPLTLRPRFEPERCRCPEVALVPCLQDCAWGVDPREMSLYDGCTTCLACVERCPSGALTLIRRRPPGGGAAKPPEDT